MNLQIKKRWLKALRSGRYEQTREMLRDNNGYCCLGVLCDVLEPDKWEQDSIRSYLHDENDIFPSDKLCKEAGLTSDHCDSLSELNDTQLKNFSEIADWIEENL